jgi:hypothetical protein
MQAYRARIANNAIIESNCADAALNRTQNREKRSTALQSH